MTDPGRRPNERAPRLQIPRRLRVQLLITDLVLIALAVGAVLYVAVFGLPQAPHSAMPPVRETYGPPTPPIHDLHKIALVIAAVFVATLSNSLNVLAPAVKLLGGKWRERAVVRFGRDVVEASWTRCAWLVVKPMLRQSSMRIAVLVSGAVGIALWNRGLAGLHDLWMLFNAGAAIYLAHAGAMLMFTTRFRTFWRRMERGMSAFVTLYCALQVAGWVL